MIRYLDLARQILGAGHLIGKHRRQQILGVHARDLRRNLLAAAKARQRERDAGVPAPAHLEHRRRAQRLHQHLANRIRMQIARRLRQLEAVRVRQRQHDVIFGRRRLQFEIERAAEALAQRQSPRAIHAAAERRMNDELHAAGFVEEALEHDRVERRQAAERRACRRSGTGRSATRLPRRDRRSRSTTRERRRRGSLPSRCSISLRRRETAADSSIAAARRLAQPERNRGRLAVRILDAHRAALDAQDSIRGIAELEHIALQALDGKVLVHGADEMAFRLEHHR